MKIIKIKKLNLSPKNKISSDFFKYTPDNGFPSDHVLLVSATTSIMFPFGRKTAAVIWLVALAVGGSGIHAGIHHPVDVVGGAIISITVSAFTYFVFNEFIKNHTTAMPKN